MSNEQKNEQRPNHRFSFILHNSYFIILLTAFAALLRFTHLNHLPPGLWFDEAWVSVAARSDATPVYFAASFGGMHPAVVYLTRLAQTVTNALGMRNHPLTIRYLLATIGTLTIPLTYFTTKAILQVTSYKLQVTPLPTHHSAPSTQHSKPSFSVFQFFKREHQSKSQKPKAKSLPLLSAAILTILYPFLHFSRLGFESMLPTPAALIAFYLLAKLLSTQHSVLNQSLSFSAPPSLLSTLYSLLLGLWLGICLYTFDTGRFIPLAIALAYWWYAWVNRREKPLSSALMPFIIIVVTAVITAAPILNFFWQNWAQFTERAAVTTYNTLGPGANSVPLAIGRNLLYTLGGLSLPGWGDMIARHNLPGRPIFDPILSIFFWLGLLALLRHPKRPLTIFTLSWLLLGLLPVILTDGAPTYTRLFVAVPVLAIIAAHGFSVFQSFSLSVFQFFSQSVDQSASQSARSPLTTQHPALPPSILSTLYSLLLLIPTILTIRDYFLRWPQHPDLFTDFQVAQYQAAQLALETSQTTLTYFAPDKINDANPTLQLLLENTDVRPHPSAPCLIYHQTPTQPLTYLIDTLADKTLTNELQQIYQDVTPTIPIRDPITNEPLYRTIQPTQHAALSTQHSAPAFAETITLTYQDPHSQFTVNNTIPITLHLTALSLTTSDYTLFFHLYPTGREDDTPLAQLDTQPCWPTGRWHTGETIRTTHNFPLPADLPAGNYTLALGLYTFPDFQRLPLTNSDTPLPDNRHILLQFTIEEQYEQQ